MWPRALIANCDLFYFHQLTMKEEVLKSFVFVYFVIYSLLRNYLEFRFRFRTFQFVARGYTTSGCQIK